ncbi:hypothetical protein EG328_002531 [Venturia inaequalis]|uniref:Uncharacterized protein n=1 Tax=Venturia inaequalis TaxID=5025 RepID=A0A8H3UVY0_VENIN|nr:hypothetical protein EG328_002531 [Venturia inaequalis]
MSRRAVTWLIAFGYLSLLALQANAKMVTLIPVPPHLTKRGDDHSHLDLANHEEFTWMVPESETVGANLTVRMPGDNENILSMARFRGMTKNIQCGDKSMEITFYDNSTFQYAMSVWDWVNGADNHTFVMVAEPGDCGQHEDRTLFKISSVQSKKENVAVLGAQKTDWATAAHTYDFRAGHVPDHEHLPLHPNQIKQAKRMYRRLRIRSLWDKTKDAIGGVWDYGKDKYHEHIKPHLPKPAQEAISKVGHVIEDGAKAGFEAVETIYQKVKDRLKPITAPILKVIGKIIPDIGPFKFSLKFKSERQTFTVGPPQLWFRLVFLKVESKGSVDWGIHEIKDGGKNHKEERKKAYIKANKISLDVGSPRLQIGTTLGKKNTTNPGWSKNWEQSKEFPIVEMAPLGFNIPGLASLGPKFGVVAKFSLGTVEASGEFFFPFNVSIPEDAILAVDLSGKKDDIVHVESWMPKFQKTGDWALTGRLSTDITARLQFRVDFASVELFGWKAAKAEVAIGPYITERFAAIVSTHEGCKKENTPNKLFSLSMTTLVGIDVRPEISFGDGAWKDFGAVWSPIEKQFFEHCYQFGPDNLGKGHIKPQPNTTADGKETYSAKDFDNPEPNRDSEDEFLCNNPDPRRSGGRTSIKCITAVQKPGTKQEGEIVRLANKKEL